MLIISLKVRQQALPSFPVSLCVTDWRKIYKAQVEKHAADITLQRQSLSHVVFRSTGNKDIQQHLAHQHYPFVSCDIVINIAS